MLGQLQCADPLEYNVDEWTFLLGRDASWLKLEILAKHLRNPQLLDPPLNFVTNSQMFELAWLIHYPTVNQKEECTISRHIQKSCLSPRQSGYNLAKELPFFSLKAKKVTYTCIWTCPKPGFGIDSSADKADWASTLPDRPESPLG